ncbi:MAG TPA: hypothetical protein VFW28_19350 [Micropepsaceae bacterium]|nr:hypothetical protein [Micropepsaceae bacterium]
MAGREFVSSARWLAIFAAGFAVLFIATGIDAAAQFGSRTRNSWLTCAYIAAKITRGGALASPKLVVISGSNATLGIDMEKLGKALSIRSFNFGLSASDGPGFQSFEAAKILRPGDAVLMPLEYLAYDYGRPQDSLVDAVYACGRDYWQSLAPGERLFYVMAAKPWRLIDAIVFEHRKDAVARTAAEAADEAGPLGQRLSEALPAPARSISGVQQPIAIRFDPSSPGVRAITKFVREAQQRHVAVFATWPNTLLFPDYRANPAFAEIRAFYDSLGVPVVGRPEDAMFPPNMMGDTLYHLNRAGIAIRTARLTQSLAQNPAFSAWIASATRRSSDPS